MLPAKAFVDIIHFWDQRFTKLMLEEAYTNLESYEMKRYVVAITDSVKSEFSIEQLHERDTMKIINTHIKQYRTLAETYLPRILILNLFTGRVFRDPTEWAIFHTMTRT